MRVEHAALSRNLQTAQIERLERTNTDGRQLTFVLAPIVEMNRKYAVGQLDWQCIDLDCFFAAHGRFQCQGGSTLIGHGGSCPVNRRCSLHLHTYVAYKHVGYIYDSRGKSPHVQAI